MSNHFAQVYILNSSYCFHQSGLLYLFYTIVPCVGLFLDSSIFLCDTTLNSAGLQSILIFDRASPCPPIILFQNFGPSFFIVESAYQDP